MRPVQIEQAEVKPHWTGRAALCTAIAALLACVCGCSVGARERHLAASQDFIAGQAGDGGVRVVMWPWLQNHAALADAERGSRDDAGSRVP